ncbi:MAG: metal ABC transporter permease [Phycisphaerae bacterium]
MLGTTLLGLAAGLVGTFAYLRRRALMGDALSHATLPGVAAAFLITGEKNLTYLLLGATVTGVLGVLAVLAIRQSSRIREDAAIGIVLSVFFGAGLALMSIVQSTSDR